MNCQQCGAANVSEARRCLNCGAELPLACERCGAGLPQGARFCPTCGQPAGPPQGHDGRQSPELPFSGPERKLITVMFADFAGFTEFVSSADVEEVHEAMGSIWAQLDAIIADHGGSVEKHMGDALMAFFGEREGREDAPALAVRAGLAIQARLQELRTQGQLPELQLRIGVHTGLVVLEPRPAASEFRATGDALNLACRLEQNAPGHGVLISHDTFRIVYGRFDVETMPPLTVKGIPEPLQTYLVSRAKPRAVARQLRDIEGVSTDMVGRKSELELLQAILHRVLEKRQSQAVTILGEAGIGKSRLLQEFQRWAELLSPPHFWLFYGQSTAEMPSLPFASLRDVFAARFEILDSDSPAVAREKLEEGIVTLLARTADAKAWPHQQSRQMAHFIGHLLALDFSSSPYLRGLLEDPEQIRQRAFDCLTQFFSALSRGTASDAEGPPVKGLLLVMEDIHWSDEASLDALAHLVRECKQSPLMLVCLARPTLLQRRPTWGEGLPTYTRLQLDSLSRRESRLLVNTILRKVALVPPALTDLITDSAEGNPFYIEEIVRMLIDQKVIIPGPDSWRVELGRLSVICVPTTLAGVLQARLDGLTPAERAVLQRASVVGRVFWDRALENMGAAGEPPADGAASVEMFLSKPGILQALTSLRLKELILQREASAFSGSIEFVFKHELLRSAAYETLLKKMRRGYHAQAAAWLIEQSGERSAEFAGLVASHLESAGRPAEAAEWYARAGLHARAGYEPAMAIQYLRQALDLCPRRRNPAGRLEWMEALGESLAARARFAEAAEIFTAMRGLAEELADLRGQARAWNQLAFLHERRADNRASVEAAEQAEELARKAGQGASHDLIRALHYKGWALYRLAEWEAVLTLARQTERLCLELNERRALATSFKLQGVVYLQRGEYAQADSFFEQGLALSREFGDRRNAAAMWSNLGESARLRGDFAAAVDFYDKALAIARQIGSRESEIVYLSNLCGARLGLEQFAHAEADLRRLIPLASSHTSSVLSEAFSFLAEACLAQGKFAEGLQAAEHALKLASDSGNELDLGIAQRLLGQLLARSDGANPRPVVGPEAPAHNPSQYFSRSLDLFNKLNAEAEQARTLRAWGQFDLAQGEKAPGARKLATALDIFQRLGMKAETARTEDVLSQTTIARVRPLRSPAQGLQPNTEPGPPGAPSPA
jgi:class 3 adenylate cyclase/tetratricopeptide (TPR) repeat protein